MNAAQANALLTLIADLAQIIYGAPTAPTAETEPAMNGQDTEKVTADR